MWVKRWRPDAGNKLTEAERKSFLVNDWVMQLVFEQDRFIVKPAIDAYEDLELILRGAYRIEDEFASKRLWDEFGGEPFLDPSARNAGHRASDEHRHAQERDGKRRRPSCGIVPDSMSGKCKS